MAIASLGPAADVNVQRTWSSLVSRRGASQQVLEDIVHRVLRNGVVSAAEMAGAYKVFELENRALHELKRAAGQGRRPSDFQIDKARARVFRAVALLQTLEALVVADKAFTALNRGEVVTGLKLMHAKVREFDPKDGEEDDIDAKRRVFSAMFDRWLDRFGPAGMRTFVLSMAKNELSFLAGGIAQLIDCEGSVHLRTMLDNPQGHEAWERLKEAALSLPGDLPSQFRKRMWMSDTEGAQASLLRPPH